MENITLTYIMYYIGALILILVVLQYVTKINIFKTIFYFNREQDKETLTLIDIVNMYSEAKPYIVDSLIINKIQLAIANDIKQHKVIPLQSIDDNKYRLLESFLDKGNIGFYSYIQCMNIPKYYIRKNKIDTRLIVFDPYGEKNILYIALEYNEFIKGIIKYVRSNNECATHKH